MRVAITGASGRLGRRAVREFLDAGHEVRAIDRVQSSELLCPYRTADIRDLGQVVGDNFQVLGVRVVVRVT